MVGVVLLLLLMVVLLLLLVVLMLWLVVSRQGNHGHRGGRGEGDGLRERSLQQGVEGCVVRGGGVIRGGECY